VPGAMGPGLALAARHIMCIRHAGPSSSPEPLLSRSHVPAAQSRMIASHGVGDFLHTYSVAPGQVDLDSRPRITCYCARTYLGYNIDTSRAVPTHLPSTVLHPFRQPRNDKWNKDKSKQTDTHQDAPTACSITCKLRYQRTIHPQWLRGVILPLFLHTPYYVCPYTGKTCRAANVHMESWPLEHPVSVPHRILEPSFIFHREWVNPPRRQLDHWWINQCATHF
jgi:hypothetical protein